MNSQPLSELECAIELQKSTIPSEVWSPSLMSKSKLSSSKVTDKKGKKPPYFEAIRSFQEIPQQYSPYAKVKILKQAIKAIYTAVEIFWSNQYHLEYRHLIELSTSDSG
jgi:hypothetical protein